MTTTQAENKQIADTILAQLGGGRFITMTGAKHFAFDTRCLIFKYPTRKGSKVSGVRVTLNGEDTYDVKFVDVLRNGELKENVVEGVYADQLQEVFTAETGLYTRL